MRKEYYFNEIESTQDYAKKIYAEKKETFIVFSELQTKGRGRYGREWKAPAGGLWFSFDMEYGNVGGIFTIAVGVAVREILEKVYNVDIKLKWPNDLILNNKKVGGILCEKINDRVIIGVGINTNVNFIDEKKATTFIGENQNSVNNYEIMLEIIKKCEEVMKYKLNDIIEEFRRHMAYIGEKCFVTELQKEVKIIFFLHLWLELQIWLLEVYVKNLVWE